MMKITVLYGPPKSPEAFESYYFGTHIPLAGKMTGLARIEVTKFLPGPDGSAPSSYRMAELYWESAAAMQRTMASPEGKAAVADLANFATGGATVLMGTVEG